MTKKRRRPINLHVMVSEEEQALIRERMAEAGIRNMGAYMRKMALNGAFVYTATDFIPIFFNVLSILTAMAPLFAISIFVNILIPSVLGTFLLLGNRSNNMSPSL